jgi:hypothetical protein
MHTEQDSSNLENQAYAKYSSRMQFEHGLINNRITWLLVTQGFLFNAYATALEKNQFAAFLAHVAIVGIAISVLAVAAITASLLAKYFAWKDLKDLTRFKSEQWWVRTPITIIAAVAELAVPVVFIGAWSLIMLNVCCSVA